MILDIIFLFNLPPIQEYRYTLMQLLIGFIVCGSCLKFIQLYIKIFKT